MFNYSLTFLNSVYFCSVVISFSIYVSLKNWIYLSMSIFLVSNYSLIISLPKAHAIGAEKYDGFIPQLGRLTEPEPNYKPKSWACYCLPTSFLNAINSIGTSDSDK